jgi:hypothetical protein
MPDLKTVITQGLIYGVAGFAFGLLITHFWR